MNYDIIGILYADTGQTVTDEEGNEYPEMQPIQGFHVNTDQPISGAEDYVVVPTTPRRVFAGIETFFYAFPDEDIFAEFAPELYPVEPEPELIDEEIVDEQL